MKVRFFEWSDYESNIFNQKKDKFNLSDLDLEFTKEKFSEENIGNAEIISIFVDSRISNTDLEKIFKKGVKKILLRCAGFNMIDTDYAKSIGLQVFRVSSYSPESIAEHVFALALAVIRKLMVDRRKHLIQNDGREIDQMGTCLYGKTIGIYGYGKIGQAVAHIAKNGFGMNVIFFDPYFKQTDENLKVDSLESLFTMSNIISVNTILNDETRGSINKNIINCGDKIVLINTSRGGVVNTNDVIEALNNGKLSGVGFDVVDEDDSYKNLPVLDNIVFTQHTAFLTEESIESILLQTFENIDSPRSCNII